ncbi:hypothetical protein [Membranihabitans marinus]|uniref:hypothetical protein n=1 Tax=Membranihabitans marinus TaxID=1227546 RepID=UPI001F45E1EF|nr:hypothetical protein [Membranihabitans marinus]
MSEDWKLELPDWKKANLKSLEFIHTKANEAFNYTTNVADKISSRAFTFISILIPILTLIISFVIKLLYVQNEPIPRCFLTNVIFICLLFVISFFGLIFIIYPKKFMHAGREPKELSDAQFIQNQNLNTEEQYLALLIGEIEGLQKKITVNERINNDRICMLKTVLTFLLIAFFCSIVVIFSYPSFIFS